MKLLSLRSLALSLTTVFMVSISQPATGVDQPTLIVLEDVPLPDAIRNLARQATMNFILDPELTSTSIDASGKFHRPPSVTKRLENKTTRAAMEEILKDHKLVLIENPATTVYRITFADRNAKPVEAAQVIGDTNMIKSPVIIEDIPLTMALRELAKAAGLKVELDAGLSGGLNSQGRMTPESYVSLRWEKLSAAQALAAVVDTYDLQMTLTADGKTYRISPKPKPENKTGSTQPTPNSSPAK